MEKLWILLILIEILQCQARSCETDEVCISLNKCGMEYNNLSATNFAHMIDRFCGGDSEDSINNYCCKRKTVINHHNCGKTVTLENRILNGAVVKVGNYPWMALLRYKNTITDELKFKCGGSLITTQYVLTAAHCINRELYSVRLGENKISTTKDCTDEKLAETCLTDVPPVQDILIDKTIIHENYSRGTGIHDIAMIKMKHEVKLKDIKGVQTICLPMNSNQNIDEVIKSRKIVNKQNFDSLTIAGWGWNEVDTQSSDDLRHANLQYLNEFECKAMITNAKLRREIPENFNFTYTNEILCAWSNSSDTCNGDSGGPIFTSAPFDSSTSSSRMVIQGVTARGLKCESVNRFLPSIYTRVSHYMNWIFMNLKD